MQCDSVVLLPNANIFTFARMKLTECPRDAMQGIHEYIPVEKKAVYINALLHVGFSVIDFGSFVSPKAIPQMRDTAELVKMLDMSATKSQLLSIILNKRGAQDAAAFDEITFLGFPFSISETFQQRNGNSTIEEALKRVEEVQTICENRNKKLLVYISMAFGNPYGDAWSSDIAISWTEKLAQLGIRYFSLADTIGVSNPENIRYMFSNLIPAMPQLEIGAHLHTRPETWKEKMEAAYASGCRAFDSAIKGFGGCPMASDKLTGNMPTENIISFFEEKNIETGLDKTAFNRAVSLALETFPV